MWSNFHMFMYYRGPSKCKRKFLQSPKALYKSIQKNFTISAEFTKKRKKIPSKPFSAPHPLMSVSTQLLSLGGLKKQEKKSLRRVSLERESSGHFSTAHHGHYAYRELSGSEQLEDGKGRRRQEMKGRRRKKAQFGAAREVFHLNLWYFTSTISHILRKAKAFYNECCCDAYEDERMKKVEVTLVDPHFSMPVLPCTSMASCM